MKAVLVAVVASLRAGLRTRFALQLKAQIRELVRAWWHWWCASALLRTADLSLEVVARARQAVVAGVLGAPAR